MRVGIVVPIGGSYFLNGSAGTAIGIAEVFKLRGHDIVFVNCTAGTGPTTDAWWNECAELKPAFGGRVIGVSELSERDGIDLLIEVGISLTPSQRKCARRCVWLVRRAALLTDIEFSMFPITSGSRVSEGISEVWVQDELATSDDVQYLELLTRLPVRRVPFLWTPSVLEAYRSATKAPVWQQVADLPDVAGRPWSVHICETNTSAISSATVPLFIVREAKLGKKIPIGDKLWIHNAHHIEKNQFFNFNVYSHALGDLPDLSGQFIGRQRVVDWVLDPKSIVVAHSRFINIRPYLLDLVWVGVPVVHNSKMLNEIGGYVSKGYYVDNEIRAGRDAFVNLATEMEAMRGQAAIDSLMAVRRKILELWSPLNESRQAAWVGAADAALAVAPAAPVAATVPVAPVAPVAPVTLTEIIVGFTDMWDQFNPEYNMFLLMMEAVTKKRVRGVKGAAGANLLIFGPFGTEWQSAPAALPKVHFTGENTGPVEGPGVILNLGFQHRPGQENYIRLPLWMLEIDWFGADVNRIQNPKPVPLERVTKIFPEELGRKTKFCSFVVTNPRQPMRNAAFQWLSQYKQVDSAGRLFNTMGETIFAGLGGGGGELKKVEFLKDYKFSLTFENESSAGYVTEKMLHAKAAGCVPIYWGDPRVEEDFNVEGFIDARGVKNSAELIELVKKVDTDPVEWLKKFSVPALDEARVEKARALLRRVGERLVGAASTTTAATTTAATTTAATTTAATTAATVAVPGSIEVDFNKTVFVSVASTKFLPSLQLWLQCIGENKKHLTALDAIVYLMNDVSKLAEDQLRQQFPFAQFRRFPKETPPGFPDFWEPLNKQNYAWKNWIHWTMNREFASTHRPIFFIDAGVFMTRWPREWLELVKTHGMSVIEDAEHTNDEMCHAVFKEKMRMTSAERKAPEIWSAIIPFIAGHPLATQVLEQAWELAQQRILSVGPKWAGETSEGKPLGHRHDQSILSILTLRLGVPRYPIEKISSIETLRHTFLTGKSMYAHRGLFKVHEPVLEGIDDVWVVNLDRRKDRLESFYAKHQDLKARTLRLPAYDGKQLKLTPKLARLFAPNDFKWKKPVIGCALSHLELWTKLVNERPEINSYLILEDDVRLSPEWRKAWEAAKLPADWDVVYLGGILPPNRAGFEANVEMVSEGVGRMKMNQMFGQATPNRYMHFCTYAYVINRRGAQKVLEVIKQRGGVWTSADHLMCNIGEFLNLYFIHPLPAGCLQDDDPAYQNSQFNNYNRVDNFDSDLWTNTEHFSEEELGQLLASTKGIENLPLDFEGTLAEARGSADQVKRVCIETGKYQLVSVEDVDLEKLYEREWVQVICPELLKQPCKRVDHETLIEGVPIIFYQRQNIPQTLPLLHKWRAMGVKFRVFHLSDEYGMDPIDFYNWPECLGVVRNYVRKDLPVLEKVVVIPLGFHYKASAAQAERRREEREFVWSFVGTGWKGRPQKLEQMETAAAANGEQGVLKCKKVFMEDWNSPNMIGREEMLEVLSKTQCVPCPRGQNAECFRVYEVLEAGAIPVLVKEGGADEEPYYKYLARWLPLLITGSWAHAGQLIQTLHAKPEVYEQYRRDLRAGWERMKKDAREGVLRVFGLA